MIQLVDTVRELNPDTYMNDPEVPVLYSNETRWKPRPFMTLLDFLDTLEAGAEPEYETVAMGDAMSKYEFTKFNLLEPE